MILLITPLAPRARRSTGVADSLRQLIASGELKPGDKLPTETALCAQFGVSRTTLREAIQMLRTNGLLDVCPGRGSFVSLPNLKNLIQELVITSRHNGTDPTEVSTLRLLIERESLQRISHSTPQQRQPLYQHVLNRNNNPTENAREEEQWHLSLVELARQPLSLNLLEALLAMEHNSRIHHYQNPDEVMRAIQIQLRLNAAIGTGEWDIAQRVLTQFISINKQPSIPMTTFTPATTNNDVCLAEA